MNQLRRDDKERKKGRRVNVLTLGPFSRVDKGLASWK